MSLPFPGLRARAPASLKLAPLLAALGLWGCLSVSDEGGPEVPLAGGSMTIFTANSQSFSRPAPGLSLAAQRSHANGDAHFEAAFVTAPAAVNPGLGPLFNATSCIACHARDGRGRPPSAEGDALGGMLFRISAAGVDAHGGPRGMPGYGGQLQGRALFGLVPEVTVQIQYRDSAVSLAGGETAVLRIPKYALANLWKPLPEAPLISPRVAPPVFGLGLLEAVPEADILRRADASDANGDGISGRPNYVYDVKSDGPRLGRFGWKANAPDLLQQSAAAYNNDMGVTTPMFPAENCEGDRDECAAHAPDVDSITLEEVAFYIRSLAVPGRRGWDTPDVQRGESLFASAGCAACHVPEMRTGAVAGQPWRSGQKFRPYTDLLLHDMGEGLADGRPDFAADGREWRTPPLWGIGLSQVVNGHTFFLHDGRARNVLEAVLWHGGEGAASREAVRNLSAADRAALLDFLESL